MSDSFVRFIDVDDDVALLRQNSVETSGAGERRQTNAQIDEVLR